MSYARSRLGFPHANVNGQFYEETKCPFEFIYVERPGPYKLHEDSVTKLCPLAPLLYDTVDLHFLRERRSYDLIVRKYNNNLIPDNSSLFKTNFSDWNYQTQLALKDSEMSELDAEDKDIYTGLL